MLAVLIFPLALQVTTDTPPQPGPKVPLRVAGLNDGRYCERMRVVGRLDELDLSKSLSRRRRPRGSSARRSGSPSCG